jgi:hypothetical protein
MGIAEDSAADYTAMMQLGYSTIRLAVLARNTGNVSVAISELWPLATTLEGRLVRETVDLGSLRLLALARLELGICLGHVLPRRKLNVVMQWTGRALRMAEQVGDTALHVQALRAHGNELRKAGRLGSAMRHLSHALDLANVDERPLVLIALARAARNEHVFRHTVVTLRHENECSTSPLSQRIIDEVTIRGLLAQGRVTETAPLLDELWEKNHNDSPQWRLIEQITFAGALRALGHRDLAEHELLHAEDTATYLRLPQQRERAQHLRRQLPEN